MCPHRIQVDFVATWRSDQDIWRYESIRLHPARLDDTLAGQKPSLSSWLVDLCREFACCLSGIPTIPVSNHSKLGKFANWFSR